MTTFEKVVKILVETKDCEAEKIKLETTFEELELDSLDTVELLMTFEEEFGISIEMNENIKTIGNIVELVDNAKA